MTTTPVRVRKQRAVMASDSEWSRIQTRARASGMNVSEYICTRLTAPEQETTTDLPDLAARLERIEWAIRFVYTLERSRVLQSDGAEVLQSLVRQVEDDFARERKLG